MSGTVPAIYGYSPVPNAWMMLSEQVLPILNKMLSATSPAVRRAAVEMLRDIHCQKLLSATPKIDAEVASVVKAMEAMRTSDDEVLDRAVSYVIADLRDRASLPE